MVFKKSFRCVFECKHCGEFNNMSDFNIDEIDSEQECSEEECGKLNKLTEKDILVIKNIVFTCPECEEGFYLEQDDIIKLESGQNVSFTCDDCDEISTVTPKVLEPEPEDDEEETEDDGEEEPETKKSHSILGNILKRRNKMVR